MESENSADENYETPPKKIKSEWSKSYSSKAFEMMCKMGYENDKGLGKLSQGRLEPIVAAQQDGRRGLGLKEDENATGEWDINSEQLHIPEKIAWLSSGSSTSNESENEFPFSLQDMKSWIHIDYKKETIDDETLFCDAELLRQVLDSKQVFDTLTDIDMRRARSRCNPFETIRSAIFLNRAAVKMANIDAMCDFMFTKPLQKNGQSLDNDSLLYFADICAGPGGFSEYVLYRKGWNAKGFGFTLRGQNDFKLDKFFAGSPESFDPFYGVKDDGDIYDTDNQNSFTEYVHKHCEEGLHFVMADGGFSVEGQENIQEILSKQLYLCQCLTALKLLRTNGHFVCKLFDLFTPFSVGLIYLMYHCFNQIAIIKPNSSRPANSERYLVCKWKTSDTQAVIDYMDIINGILNSNKQTDSNQDVLEIVHLDIIMQDREFLYYITDSNNAIAREQIVGLKKIAAFCSNQQLKETRQTECRKRCLELWKLPDKLRQVPEPKVTERLLQEIFGDWFKDIKPEKLFSSVAQELCSPEQLKQHVYSIYDWHFVPVGRSETSINACSMFLCKSRGNLLRFSDTRKWDPVDYTFEVSPKTLFYGEIVYEYTGEGRTQTRVCGLHIIDAIMLGGVDIRRQPLVMRLKLINKYCQSINKPFKEGSLSVRCKKLYRLQQLDDFFDDMRPYMLKDSNRRLGFALEQDNKFFVPGGIMLLCEVSHSYYSIMSKSRKMLYYFDTTTGHSYYTDQLPEPIQKLLWASFRNSYSRRLLWKWSNTTQVESCLPESAKVEKLLYRIDLKNYIMDKLRS